MKICALKSFISASMVALISSGCTVAYIQFKHNWIPPSDITVNIEYFNTQNEVSNYCMSRGVIPPKGFKVLACSVKLPDRCDIFIKKDYEEFVLTHELLHCSGWKHTSIIVDDKTIETPIFPIVNKQQ